jgi:hypothetical protein
MAHELTITKGQAEMVYAGEPPWHGLGTKVEGCLRSAEALRIAGLDWHVEQWPLYTQGSDGTGPTGRLDGHVATSARTITGSCPS